MNKTNLETVLKENYWGGHGVCEGGLLCWTNTIKGVYHHLSYPTDDTNLVVTLQQGTEGNETTTHLNTVEEVGNLGTWDYTEREKGLNK